MCCESEAAGSFRKAENSRKQQDSQDACPTLGTGGAGLTPHSAWRGPCLCPPPSLPNTAPLQSFIQEAVSAAKGCGGSLWGGRELFDECGFFMEQSLEALAETIGRKGEEDCHQASTPLGDRGRACGLLAQLLH